MIASYTTYYFILLILSTVQALQSLKENYKYFKLCVLCEETQGIIDGWWNIFLHLVIL